MKNKLEKLANIVFSPLPIHWQGKIISWLRGDLRKINQFTLENNPTVVYQPGKPQVLFWRGAPGRSSINGEALIAMALRLRGIDARFIICDATLSGCIQRSLEDDIPISKWGDNCRKCVDYGVRILDGFAIPYVGMSELVSRERRVDFREISDNLPIDKLPTYVYGQVRVGQLAESSALRYLKGQSLANQEPIFREYLYSALVCSEAARNALNGMKPSHVFMQAHIQYVDWAPAYVLFTNTGLPVTIWGGSPIQEGSIILRNVSYTDWGHLWNISKEAWERQSKHPLTQKNEEALDSVLRSPWKDQCKSVNSLHYSGTFSKKEKTKEMLLRDLNISDDRPIWCVFSQMTWDAGFNPEVMIFEDVVSWLLTTVSTIRQIADVNWLLKAHPGESRGTTFGIVDIVKENFPDITQNIRIIPPKSTITTYDLVSILSGGVTIQGTVGVQLPARGIPVIVAAKTHYTGKGFTYDGVTKEKYVELLHQANDIPCLSEYQKNLARRYAYSLFFQRSIPINVAKGQSAYSPIDPNKLDLLSPGKDPAMEMICNRIMDEGEFILNDPLAI